TQSCRLADCRPDILLTAATPTHVPAAPHPFPTRRSSDLLDTTISADIPGVPADATVTKLRHGAAIKVFDSSQLPNRKLVQHLRRSEEHTSELQSRENLVCRLLLEKKK